MVTLPLGIGAYKRELAGEPEIRLVNRFVETDPTNLREHIALLTRCGTSDLAGFAGGLIRGNYSKPGLFNGDLFTVSGENLWRYAADGTKTQITGVINGTGNPTVTWMKGIGYEYLFIADGLLLQFYSGGTHAAGTLTNSGGAITTQVVKIGATYYKWDANVNVDLAADGTVTHPWVALLGVNDAGSMENLAKLINFDGARGVDFSPTLGGPSLLFSARWDSGTPAVIVVTARSVYADGNAITTTVPTGSFLAWGAATMTGGGTHALEGVAVPDGVGIRALATVSGYVLASVADSQKFFWINPGEVTIDPLDFAEKESNPDNITDMLTVGDQVMITGQASTENWYATGNAEAPFVPVQGRVYERGAVDGTPVLVKDTVILVGNDSIVYQIGAGGVERISTHGIEERIRTQLSREQGL